MGHQVTIRQQNQMLLDCMHVYVIYLHVHNSLYIERNFVISSRGVSALSNNMATRCNRIDILQQTIFAFTNKQNLIIWGFQMCLQNMDFDALFMYHQVICCVSFSFKVLICQLPRQSYSILFNKLSIVTKLGK